MSRPDGTPDFLPTCNLPAGREDFQFRRLTGAFPVLARMGAPKEESTPVRRPSRVGWFPGKHLPTAFLTGGCNLRGSRFQEPSSIRMGRGLEEHLHRAGFHQSAAIHDRDPIR